MNNPPEYALSTLQPQLVGKVLQFAQKAWNQSNWSAVGGPLEFVEGGVSNLSIRVMESWEYEVGGGLKDPYHYDVDSILTVVILLSEAGDCEGGEFRSFEHNDEHKVYSMEQGDGICFVSHKYVSKPKPNPLSLPSTSNPSPSIPPFSLDAQHNITELTKGHRRSLVTELWQGGVGHCGR
jgi:hypothetical protein